MTISVAGPVYCFAQADFLLIREPSSGCDSVNLSLPVGSHTKISPFVRFDAAAECFSAFEASQRNPQCTRGGDPQLRGMHCE